MWQLLFRSNFYAKSEFCERKIVGTDNWTAQLAETITMYLLLSFVELHTMYLQNTADLHSIVKQHVKQWIMESDQSSPVLALSQISLPVIQCALYEDIGRDRARTGSDAWWSVAWSKALLTEKECDQNWLVWIIGVTSVCCQIPSYICWTLSDDRLLFSAWY